MIVPTIKNIDLDNRKLYLEIDGLDFWNRAGCLTENYDRVLPDWQEQMLNIIQTHRNVFCLNMDAHATLLALK
jgi:hypothetical protein